MARLKLQHDSRPKRKARAPRGVKELSERGGSVFLPDKLHLVRMVAMRGASDDEMADTFGVSRDAFQKWRKTYPSFDEALEKGRLSVDADVVVSLYKQTQGYEYEEEMIDPKGRTTTFKKFAKPDSGAIEYWLNNRQPEQWKSRSTTRVAGGGKGEEPLGVKLETRSELIDAIVAMISPKPDGQPKGKAPDDGRIKR